MHATPQAYFDSLSESLKSNPDKGKAIAAVVQFKLSGASGGDWVLDLSQAPGTVSAGTHDAPKTTILMADTDFLDVVNKKMNSQMSFMQGKLKFTGDPGTAMKLAMLL
jgi:putative sterol carrier protein